MLHRIVKEYQPLSYCQAGPQNASMVTHRVNTDKFPDAEQPDACIQAISPEDGNTPLPRHWALKPSLGLPGQLSCY